MKLMCISILPQLYNQTNIEVGRVYDIQPGEDRWYDRDKRMIYVILEDGTRQEYPKSCFISLEKFSNQRNNI